MKKLVWLAVLSGFAGTLAWGGEFEVISQANGVITWRNPSVNSTCTVEWALSPAGPWHQDWTNFQNLVVTTPVAHARLPMFYRVVSALPEDMPHTNMIAHYTFNGDALDVTGNGHDGVLYGGTYVEDRYGTYQGAIEFDGSTDGYVDVGDIDIPLPTTVSLWFRAPATNTDWSTIFGWNLPDSPYSGIQLAAIENGHMVSRIGNEFTDFETTETPNGDGQWHLLAATRDAENNHLIYLDGELVGSQTVDAPIGSGHHLYIGRSFRPNDYILNEHFRGGIDDVRIYDYVLSAEEIQSLWANSP